jgi:serine/threonine protein kinase
VSAHPSPAVAPALPGYRSDRLLGSGGFADVFLYEQTETQAFVAVKVLRASALSPQARQQLVSEAQALGRLTRTGRHPHIVTVHSVTWSDDRPGLVMEFCPGISLAAAVTQGRRFEVPHVLRIGVQIAGALATAHLAGIVHRDVKPGNIMIGADDEPKLGDFGIAALNADEVARGSDCLSVHYAAPEVLDVGGDEGSDLYALAATLYELLAGHPPFSVPGGDNSPDAVERRIRTVPVPPIERSDVPPGVRSLLRAAMDKDPYQRARRIGAARNFAKLLSELEQELGYPATPIRVYEAPAAAPSPPPPPPPPPVVPHPAQPPRIAPEPPWDREQPADDTALRPVPVVQPEPGTTGSRRTSLWWAGAAAVVLAAAGAGLAWGGGADPGTPVVTTAPAADPPADAVGELDVAVPAPIVSGRRRADGSALFTWTYDRPAEGDFFAVTRTDVLKPESGRTATATWSVRASRGERPCIEVTVVRRGRASSAVRACVS